MCRSKISIRLLPVSSAMNKESPMPTGAIKVPLCFSAASMNIVKTSSVVKNISMKRACTIEQPPPSDVCTLRGPGKRQDTTAAAAIPASI